MTSFTPFVRSVPHKLPNHAETESSLHLFCVLFRPNGPSAARTRPRALHEAMRPAQNTETLHSNQHNDTKTHSTSLTNYLNPTHVTPPIP